MRTHEDLEEDPEGEDEHDELLIVSGVKTIRRYWRDGREIFVLDLGHGPRRYAAVNVNEARPWAGRN